MAAAAGAGQTPSAQTATRDLYELRRYRLRVGAQRDAARSYFRDALVPALGRLGLGPVGVFDAFVGEGPLAVVLFRHPSADSVVSLGGRLLGDAAYR